MFNKNNFVPNKEFLLSCLRSLFDLMDIYKDEIISLIDNNTLRRLSQLSNAARDEELRQINESLQMYLYTSKYILELNQDEIF